MTGPLHLLREGLETQLRLDAGDAVQAIVRFVLAERPLARLLDRAVRAGRGVGAPEWFAAANGARCWLRLRAAGAPGGALACARRANERRAVDWLRAALDGVPWCDARFDLRGAAAAVRGLPRPAAGVARAARVARALGRGRDPFLVARAVELVCYYDRLGRLLDAGRHRLAVTSTYSNPWGLALNLAARRRGIPVVHVMHGAPLWPVPRLDCDLLVANDEASCDVLARAGWRVGRAIVKSARAGHRPFPAAPPERRRTVGLFLTKEPAVARARDWVTALLADPSVARVVVRPHPANLWAGLGPALAGLPPGRAVVSDLSAAADLARCDLVLAGNSSAHLEALVAGVPTAYDPELDHGDGGALSFVREGLLYRADAGRAPDLAAALAFYRRPAWRRAFARYANLRQSEAEVAAEVRAAVARLLAGGRA